MYLELTFLSYIFDKLFGEFSFIKFYKHPVVLMGNFIKWFEKNFYKDSIARGGYLTLSLLILTFTIVYTIEYFIDNIFILALIGSTAIASRMLYESVKDVIANPSHIKYLVSRDTDNLSQSDINKAAIETYAENLSDGVIAPLFYMLLFGLYGAFLYKAVNTLDSMVGYRNEKYENFGKFSAKLDDILNYIPSRITALLIAILFISIKALKSFYHYGKHHKSPNAGHPIAAMALSLNISLGGPTSYFGKIQKKPYFGDGKTDITHDDINKALSFRVRFDTIVLLTFIVYFIYWI
jgi:adenosylcobinamide-phosphate synthase